MLKPGTSASTVTALSFSTTRTRGKQIALPLTQAEMGELLGVTRETVTRALAQFRDHNLAVLKGSTLTIPNRAALESFAVHQSSQADRRLAPAATGRL